MAEGKQDTRRLPTQIADEAYCRAIESGADEEGACKAAIAAEMHDAQERCQHWIDKLAKIEALKPNHPVLMPKVES